MTKSDVFELGHMPIALGETRDLTLPVTQSYVGAEVSLPIRVKRGAKPGPAVFVTAALHGDELNGTGIIRALILEEDFELVAGTLVLVPVVNILGFERHVRYLPDRRDLNRCFPGSPTGSLASRYAHTFFDAIVSRCNYGLDLHTAAARRVNCPNVRGDLANPAVTRLAKAFGCEVIVNGKGPKGSLRRAACKAGCPTIILEAGENLRIQPGVVEVGCRGVRNVLIDLGMVDAEPVQPRVQALIRRTRWLRADRGGMLQFHVALGELVKKGQTIATNTNLLGQVQSVVESPVSGIAIGMTTLPFVGPGDPICHVGVPERGIGRLRRLWVPPVA